MVEVRFYVNKDMLCMKVEGHAEAAPKGEDIVCAGVSALAGTLADYVYGMNNAGMMEREPQIQMNNGHAKIKAAPKPEAKGRLLLAFSVITTGMRAIKRNYPENVDLTLFDQSDILDFSKIPESSTLRTD